MISAFAEDIRKYRTLPAHMLSPDPKWSSSISICCCCCLSPFSLSPRLGSQPSCFIKKKPICFSGQNSSILKSRLTVHRSSPYRSSRFTLSPRLSLYLRRGEQQACRIARVRSMVGSMLVRSMGLRSCYLDPLHQPLYTALSLWVFDLQSKNNEHSAEQREIETAAEAF